MPFSLHEKGIYPDSPQKNPFSVEQWITWVVATLVAAVTMMVFFYTNFETKSDSDETNAVIEKRLDRIENKLDQILVNRKRSF